jgi:conjugal transfer mating pair stabilization protein TraG
MNWDIYAYGNGDILRLILNGVAMFFGNADYYQAMLVVAMMAFVAILIRAAFNKELLQNFQWMMALIFTYFILFVPKVDVVIQDQVKTSDVFVVNNLPLGMAASVGFFSHLGHWLTSSYETVFSLPNELSYRGNGIMFAQSMMEEMAKRYEINDGYTTNSFSQFWESCVIFDGIGNNRFTLRDIVNTNDLEMFFRNNVAVNAAYFRYTDRFGVDSNQPCRDGWDMVVLDVEADMDVIRQVAAKGLVGHTGSLTAATTILQNNASRITPLVQAAQSSGFHEKQAIFRKSICSSANFTALKVPGQEQSAAKLKVSCEILEEEGLLTSFGMERLPMMMGLVVALIYALFPVISLMVLVSPMKVSLGYIKALVWVALWPLMFAIIHFVMTYYARQWMGEANTITTPYSIHAHNDYLMYILKQRNLAAAMVISIPLISYMLISQSGAMMAGAVGRMMSNTDSSIDRAGNNITDGQDKFKGADYRLDEAGGAYVRQSMTSDGSTQTYSSDGQQFTNQATNSYSTQLADAQRVTEGLRQTLSQATAKVSSEEASLVESNSSLLNETRAVSASIAGVEGTSESLGTSQNQQLLNSMNEAHSRMKEAADTKGVAWTEQDTGRVFANAGIHAKWDSGSQLFGGIAKLASGASVGGKLEGGAGYEGTNSHTDTLTVQQKEAVLSSSGVTESLSDVASVISSAAINSGISKTDTNMEGLQSSQNEAVQNASSLRESVSEQERVSRDYGLARDYSTTLTQDNITALKQSVVESGIVSAAEFNGTMNDARNGGVDGEIARDQIATWAREQIPSRLNSSANESLGSSIHSEGLSGMDSLRGVGDDAVMDRGVINSGEIRREVGAEISSESYSDRMDAARGDINATQERIGGRETINAEREATLGHQEEYREWSEKEMEITPLNRGVDKLDIDGYKQRGNGPMIHQTPQKGIEENEWSQKKPD